MRNNPYFILSQEMIYATTLILKKFTLTFNEGIVKSVSQLFRNRFKMSASFLDKKLINKCVFILIKIKVNLNKIIITIFVLIQYESVIGMNTPSLQSIATFKCANLMMYNCLQFKFFPILLVTTLYI